MDTKVTFRIYKQLKEEASRIYESIGLDFSSALNLFLKQTVIENRLPLNL